jgi:putative ABC transport system permease protein
MMRDHRGRSWAGLALSHDLRAIIRALVRSPVYAGSSVLLIAVGIGATAATYGAIQAAVLRQLPLPAPQELVAVQNVDIAYNLGIDVPRPRAVLQELARLDVFSGVAADAVGAMNLGGGGEGGEAERVSVAYVSSDYFHAIGVAPLAGRAFTADEGRAGGDWHVAMLSHRLWMRRFAGSRNAVGGKITLNGHTYRVIGVMPQDFTFPSAPALWLPLPLPISNLEVFEAFGNFIPIEMVARLRRGVSLRSANLAVAKLERGYPTWSFMSDSAAVLVRPLQESMMTAKSRHALLGIGVAASLVLLVATANFAGLLVAHTIGRLPDLRVRVMLGASRGHITRMVGVEALLLGLAGAVGGILVARGCLPILNSILPPQVLAVARPKLDPTLILLAIAMSMLVAAIVTLAFARAFGWGGVEKRYTIQGRASPGLTWRVGEWIGGFQIALALLLVTGAGVLGQRVYQLTTVDTGMNLDGVVAGGLTLTRAGYESQTAIATFVMQAVTTLSKAPGVQSAAAVDILPIAGHGGLAEAITPLDAPADTLIPRRYAVTPGYFRAMGIPLLSGRDFTWTDPPSAGVILNALAAHLLWPGKSAVGQQILIGKDPHAVVGVVGDVRTRHLSEVPRAQIYVPFAAAYGASLSIVARGGLSRSVMASRIRDAVRSVDRQQPVSGIENVATLVQGTIAGQRSAGILLAAFGLIALIVATVGVYALTVYRVVAQRREVAIRVALGATPWAMLWRILGRAAVSGAAGLALGVVATLSAARFVSGLIPDAPNVGYSDLVAALLVLFAAVMIAALVPALRGLRTDPMAAFRSE